MVSYSLLKSMSFLCPILYYEIWLQNISFWQKNLNLYHLVLHFSSLKFLALVMSNELYIVKSCIFNTRLKRILLQPWMKLLKVISHLLSTIPTKTNVLDFPLISLYFTSILNQTSIASSHLYLFIWKSDYQKYNSYPIWEMQKFK